MADTKAIIFDLDDTLVSTANGWLAAETVLCRELGGEYSPQIAQSYKGCNARDVGRVIHQHLQPSDRTAEECGARMRELLIDTVSRSESRVMPGAHELLAQIPLPMAIASGSPLEVIQCHLDHLGGQAHFQVLVSSEDLEYGKPAPDVYLRAAERLGIAPREALVFEDSVIGLQAAKSAGMRCVVIPSTPGPPADGQAPSGPPTKPPGFEMADSWTASLADLDLKEVLA